jgi:threonine dehydrogenase-like Zn-dependent dehydrogenase
VVETMPAVVFERLGKVTLVERSVPTVSDQEDVLVRVTATGICGTDRGIVLGGFPAALGVILGHEAIGAVEAVGQSVRSVEVGDRVVLNPTFYCGHCRPCRRGMMAHCETKDGHEIGVDSDGTMTGHVLLNERFIHRLPPDMPWRRAVLIEPLACVLNNLTAAAPRWDDQILVVGAGPIGALCALMFAARGASVTVAERDPARVDLARSLLPWTVRVAGLPTGHLTDALEDAPARPDVVIDTTGVLLEEALGLVGAGGTVVVMGEREAALATVCLRPLVTRGIRVVGAGPYPPHLFPVALEVATRMPLESLVTHVLPLERYADGFALLGVVLGESPRIACYRAMKVLLVSDEEVTR